MDIVISSGHGKIIRGAKGYIDEVDEARKVVERVAELLRGMNVGVKVFHDDVSKTQSENLNRIVNYHNAQKRDLDVSIHFNAYETTSKAMGHECLYKTQSALAKAESDKTSAAAGFINRGPKKRDNLAFLNNTNKPSILVEVCFVDSKADVDIYHAKFAQVCQAIAESISGKTAVPVEPPKPAEPPGAAPPEVTEPIPPPVSSSPRPTQRKGDKGELVKEIQRCLETPADGDFGPTTEGKVKDFQRSQGLGADGICGPQTWGALEYVYNLPPYTPPPSTLTPDEVRKICDLARASKAQQYNWSGRGIMPPGYCQGVAVAWGCAYRKYLAGHPVFREAAIAKSGDKDALTQYDSIFRDAGMRNDVAGVDTLRHVYVLLIGLGMRESSGRHCEGRDMSASNVQSDTCESGAWQQSWDSKGYSPSLMQQLFDEYAANSALGYLDIFKQGVSCSSSSWSNYGSGAGAQYQKMAKNQPMMAADMCALCMRKNYKHWGPLIRREAQVRKEVDELLLQVQELLAPAVG